jgi:Sulfatase-modifying factor enzyme 1
MRRRLAVLAMIATAGSLLTGPAVARKCKSDAAQVGDVCVDLYEASVWEIPAGNAKLIGKVRKSKASAADLSAATQGGLDFFDLLPDCPATGNGCTDVYAVSIAGATPARFISWFQAAAACRNSGKRLATNQEWQMAALGTPDPGVDNGTSDCNIEQAGDVLATGARAGCVSDTGHFDMVGNVAEWVADWNDLSSACSNFSEEYGDDSLCMDGDGLGDGPAALVRGGSWDSGTGAGVFATSTRENFQALLQNGRLYIGFRCARAL